MKFKTLDSAVLVRDLPDQGLRKGDLGAIVEVYEPDSVEVEFVNAGGETEALVTLKESDLRPLDGDDMMAARRPDDPS